MFGYTGGEGGLEGLDDVGHGLVDGGHLGLGVEAGDDGVEAGGEAEVVHLLGALADGVLGVDAGAVHVALLDRLLHLELLRLLLLLALARLPLQRLGGELEVHDLVQQLLRAPHGSLARAIGFDSEAPIGRPSWSLEFAFDEWILDRSSGAWTRFLSEGNLCFRA